MKKLFVILVCCLSLTACLPAAFVAGAAASGAVVTDGRDMKTQLQDKTIAHRVRTALHLNKHLDKSTIISVSTFNRVVLLTGRAPNEELHELASKIAHSVKNVKRVHNEIVIGDNTSFKEAAQDTWLTTKIKSSLLAERGLNSAQIKVVTDNSTAYLMGLVSRDQADLATNVTRHVPGVDKVVKLFEYTSERKPLL
ncbi:MAG: BON domain-containing protein [Gammaproteobacteria bacterium]|nr:BON domain-containing protein [Gammaproteobacteria bacterium]